MKPSTDNWLKIAAKDLKMAKLCLDGDEPLGVIHHLHAAIEKLLKGICTELVGDPPKIHSLQRLAVEVCKLDLEKKQSQMLKLLDEAYIDSRYPEDIERFQEEFDLDICNKLFTDTKEVFRCLKSLIVKS